MLLTRSAEDKVSEEHINKLDTMLKDIDSDIALSMSYVRRAHDVSFPELKKKFSGINVETLQKYMQASYTAHRPIHVVAAYSWAMMVPMTAFYYGLKLREYYRGMDDASVEALVRIGKLPTEQFNSMLDIITHLYSDKDKEEFEEFRLKMENTEGYREIDYNSLFPPKVLDLEAFGEDYYRSVAITAKRFRKENNISEEFAARVLGLSPYQYGVLENENKPVAFSVAIGFRAKLGFQLISHVDFTSDMIQFPAFHHLRIAQHVRDALIVEAMRRLADIEKKNVSQMLLSLSNMYI
ncbi:hypothetical protein LRP49_09045 [Enterovibrio sp. ZSDZ35]|uniref:HTH cro/C1-type domain-containing protein n=1 Tax=Enterovibrio qingdaonensis TaxID=2899818 RepID=A0ABT5QK40_9GAMM|nr:hypothetical protein [Enterovibrio sp. ZSDZ35]MDD1781348.1 hypothetical protein [Enterovibrio sp. ZSDZ35]